MLCGLSRKGTRALGDREVYQLGLFSNLHGDLPQLSFDLLLIARAELPPDLVEQCHESRFFFLRKVAAGCLSFEEELRQQDAIAFQWLLLHSITSLQNARVEQRAA